MQLKRDQVNTILKNAPAGIDKKKLLDGLIMRGYDIEGVDSAAIRQSLQTTQTSPMSANQETSQDARQTGQEIVGNIKQRGSNINQITSDVNSGKINPIRGGFQAAGQVAGGVSDTIGSIFKGAVKSILPEQAEQSTREVVNQFGENVAAIPEVQQIVSKYNSLTPEQKRDVDAAGGIVSLVSEFVGGGVVSKGAKTAVKTGKRVVSNIENGLEQTGNAVKQKVITATANTPEKIMQRVARIPKGEQAKFEKLAGESVGEYLTSRNIYGDPQEIGEQLYKRFELSKNTADEAIAQLPGKYNPKQVETALRELVDRENRISSPGAESPDLNRATELLNKITDERGGLTMSEINEAKRMFERNIRLDFVKQNLPEGVARATNIDNAIRKWQFEQAETLGLKNLPDINKETQLAKKLLDALGKENAGIAGNNATSLTDFILLSGGDPSAVGMYVTKKIIGSKKLQSAVAKRLNKGKPVKGEVKADMGPSKVLQLPAGNLKARRIINDQKVITVSPRNSQIDIVGKEGIGEYTAKVNKPTMSKNFSVGMDKVVEGLNENEALKSAVIGKGKYVPGEVYYQEVMGKKKSIIIAGKNKEGEVLGWYLPDPETAGMLGQKKGYLIPAKFSQPAKELKVINKGGATDEELKKIINKMFFE